MIVRTYTNMWNEEKKLYAIYDITLPTPISFKQIGLFFLGAIAWMPLMYIIGVKITTPVGLVVWFSAPVLLAIVGNQQLFQGKSIFQFAKSTGSFLFEPRRVLDGEGLSVNVEKLPKTVKRKDKETGETFEEIVHPTIELKYQTWSKKPLERI